MIAVILTCFNRKEKTVNCIRKLKAQENVEDIVFLVVDDGSKDGTREAIEQLPYLVKILKGSGNFYWAGGMRVGIQYYLDHRESFNADYVLLVNDDVDFYPEVLHKMVALSREKNGAVIVGNCCDENGNPTYGAIQCSKNIFKRMYDHLTPDRADEKADTFNCNCVLIQSDIMHKAGNFDPVYTHNFADYDYGMTLTKRGYEIYGTPFFVGVCSDNSRSGTWEDRSLPRKERMKRKESPKGLPQKEWNHFLLKNFGILWWIRYGYTAKMKILLKR